MGSGSRDKSWSELVRDAAALRAEHRRSVPRCSSVQSDSLWMAVLVLVLGLACGGGLLMEVQDGEISGVAAVAWGIGVAAFTVAGVGYTLLFGGRLMGGLRWIARRTGGEVLGGCAAAQAELDWQDAHGWAHLEYFAVDRGYRAAVSGAYRGFPVLVTIAAQIVDASPHRDRTACYVARPGRPDRALRPEVRRQLEVTWGFGVHLGPYGLCLSRDGAHPPDVKAIIGVLDLISEPERALFV